MAVAELTPHTGWGMMAATLALGTLAAPVRMPFPGKALGPWFSTFLMPLPFNAVSCVKFPNSEIISLLLHYCLSVLLL